MTASFVDGLLLRQHPPLELKSHHYTSRFSIVVCSIQHASCMHFMMLQVEDPALLGNAVSHQ
jgi:hypothetical protein